MIPMPLSKLSELWPMLITQRDDPTELFRQALDGLDEQVAELRKTRAQLAALIDERSTVQAAPAVAPQKRKLSAAWIAKISVAAKARWARVKKAQAKAQKPTPAAKKTQSKVKSAKARLATAKTMKSAAKKGKSKPATPMAETEAAETA
jgi:hypothetical protein